MKKTLKIVFTILYVLEAVLAVINMPLIYTRDPILFIVLSLLFFVTHLLTWAAPKTFFDLIWKISAIFPDSFDYDTSYKKLDVCGLGIAITADLFLALGLIIATL